MLSMSTHNKCFYKENLENMVIFFKNRIIGIILKGAYIFSLFRVMSSVHERQELSIHR